MVGTVYAELAYHIIMLGAFLVKYNDVALGLNAIKEDPNLITLCVSVCVPLDLLPLVHCSCHPFVLAFKHSLSTPRPILFIAIYAPSHTLRIERDDRHVLNDCTFLLPSTFKHFFSWSRTMLFLILFSYLGKTRAFLSPVDF